MDDRMDDFARRVLRWYDRHGRHDLPWQHPRTPYRVWVSEVMLQQTQVATVIAYFERFVTALPDIRALAAAPEDRVMALWSGLGYYRRARYLHVAARVCVAQHQGELPRDFGALAALPGIGRSTAGAILALARAQRHAILDGNVKRLLSRHHGLRGWPGVRAVENALWTHAETHTPSTRVADYTQAVMDLGATVCTRGNPHCNQCPLAHDCIALRDGLTTEIPAPRPARALPEKHLVLVLLRDPQDRVLLQRRPVQGVWPGLWSLPEAGDNRGARGLASRLAELDGKPAIALPEIRHAFTHFKLLASPLEWRHAQAHPAVADVSDLRWCSQSDIMELGMPEPIRKLLGQRLAPARRDAGTRHIDRLEPPQPAPALF
ncbi:MAG TPA: A/G-specific adenine glycosylase [Rhodanobacteraceae bacterium]|nr:A/G-specific adenine glycosylase [Rhodanobacteraceae bacterium]